MILRQHPEAIRVLALWLRHESAAGRMSLNDPHQSFDAPRKRQLRRIVSDNFFPLACSTREGETVVRNHSCNINAKVEASCIANQEEK